MTLNRRLFALTLLLCTFQLSAQFGGTCDVSVLKERLKSSTTYIVLTGDEKFDDNLAKGFEHFWNLTEYEFVASESEFDQADQSNSYLVPTTMTVSDQYSTQHYNRYSLLIGGTENVFYRTAADIILDNFGYEKYITEAAYRAYGIPKLLQDFIQMRLDGEPISGGTVTRIRYTAGQVYNKKSNKIVSKTLLVDERFLKSGPYFPKLRKTQFDKEVFKALYTGKVKFVSTEELETAINENDPAYCYMLQVNSRKKYLFVIDCESGSLWYNGYETGGIGITKKDVKTLKKAVF